MSVRIFSESAAAVLADAVAEALADREVRRTRAASFEALGAAGILEVEAVSDSVVFALAARDAELSLLASSTNELRAAVVVPFEALVSACRTLLDRWMEEGRAGAIVVVIANHHGAPSLLEAAVQAFVRSLAKEQARRGVCPFAIVSSSPSAAAEAARVLTTTALMVGETVYA